MEKEVRAEVRGEFGEILRRQVRDIEIAQKRFKDFKSDVTAKVKADLA